MDVVLFGPEGVSRKLYRDALRAAGHTVDAVGSLAEARRAYERRVPKTTLILAEADPEDAFLVAATARVHHPAERCVVLIPEGDTSRAARLEQIRVEDVLPDGTAADRVVAALAREVTAEPNLTNWSSVGKYELDALRALHARSEGSVESTWLLGFALYRAGSFEEAAPLLAEVRRRDPENLQAVYYLGSCHYRMKAVDQAVRYWREASEADPSGATGTKARAHLERVQG